MTGDNDDWQLGGPGCEFPQDVKTGCFWHVQVEQQTIENLAVERLQQVLPALKQAHPEPICFQQTTERLTKTGFIVEHGYIDYRGTHGARNSYTRDGLAIIPWLNVPSPAGERPGNKVCSGGTDP